MDALSQIIRREIDATGVMPFARFMELALYCPLYGFYEQEADIIGRAGHFYTNVSVGPLFGQLLAFQFARWLQEDCPPEAKAAPAHWVEAGAHDGRLAADMLTWLRRHRPALFERLQYWIVEPSARQRARQEQTLREFGAKVRWVERVSELACRGHPEPKSGHFDTADAKPVADCWVSPLGYEIIFSNELLDALPVHRLGWDAARRVWFEWGVTVENEAFVWTRLPGDIAPDAQSFLTRFKGLTVAPEIAPALPEVLPDGFVIELNPAAQQWWHQAARGLRRGKLMAIDYGLTAAELLQPERRTGTLRAYHRHHPSGNLLARPGEQDLTAHVNFTALQAVGEMAGLRTDGLFTQAQFLTRIAERVWKSEEAAGKWTAEQNRQFVTLTHPEHLGRAFCVLIQSRASALA